MLIQNPLDGSQSSGTLLVTKPERNYFKHIQEKILKKKKKKKKNPWNRFQNKGYSYRKEFAPFKSSP